MVDGGWENSARERMEKNRGGCCGYGGGDYEGNLLGLGLEDKIYRDYI